MATRDRFNRAFRAIGELFPTADKWEPKSAPPGTEKPTPRSKSGGGRFPGSQGSQRREDRAHHVESDAWAAWEERAAILEYDGGFSRAEAEARATAEPEYRSNLSGSRFFLPQTDAAPDDPKDSIGQRPL